MVSSSCHVRFYGSTSWVKSTLDVSEEFPYRNCFWHELLPFDHRAIQCSLPVNLFNEIIFLIFWTWLVFLTVLSCFSLIFYIVTISMKIERKSFRNYLRVRNPTLNEQNEDEKRFLVDYLQMDGTLVLQILAQNTNDVVMSKLVLAIYQKYNNSPMNVDRSNWIFFRNRIDVNKRSEFLINF